MNNNHKNSGRSRNSTSRYKSRNNDRKPFERSNGSGYRNSDTQKKQFDSNGNTSNDQSSNRNVNKSYSERNRRSSGGYKGGNSYNKNGGRTSWSSYNNKSRNRGRKSSYAGKQKIHPSKYISKEVKVEVKDKNEYQGVDFKNFNISDHILKNLAKKGFKKTTKVQEITIPIIQDGKNILGISATGSGKTGAFLIPMIDKIYKDPSEKIIVVAPTRELAQQIFKEGISIVNGTKIKLALIIGGESAYRQISKLRQNPSIIVGTPGRLIDMSERGNIKFGSFKNIVIDEVDRMLDMGFVQDIKRIYEQTDPNRQSLFFSATMDRRIEGIIKDMTKEYELIKLSENKPTESVLQDVIYFKHKEEKEDLLHNLLIKEEVTKTVIFVDTKRYADKIGKTLEDRGINSGVIHGDKSQFKRKKILDLYRSSRFNVLVATNVAARGIDIDDISHVINLDEPQTYDEYIHRIGRTGRNGKTGTAYTFVEKRY